MPVRSRGTLRNKSAIRMPKSETNPKPEIRNSQHVHAAGCLELGMWEPVSTLWLGVGFQRAFPLTPALSRREREPRVQRLLSPGASASATRRNWVSPRPWGENLPKRLSRFEPLNPVGRAALLRRLPARGCAAAQPYRFSPEFHGEGQGEGKRDVAGPQEPCSAIGSRVSVFST